VVTIKWETIGRRKYIENFQGYTSLEGLIINSVTPYFEPGGAGKSSLTLYEEAFFKFYVSLHANFPINLTDDILNTVWPRETDDKNDKAVKTTLFMEVASYCLRHCLPPQNYVGIQDSSSVNDTLYFFLKSSFQQEFYRNNYARFEFQDYVPRLLRLLESKNDPYVDEVKAKISLATSKAHIENIKINLFSLGNNQPIGQRLYSLTIYVFEQVSLVLKHFFVFLVIWINFPTLAIFICLGILGFSGGNAFSYKEIKIQSYTGKDRSKKFLSRISYPLKYIRRAISVIGAKVFTNIISTYKNVESPLLHKFAVQGIIISLTVYFSFLKDFITTYTGGE